MSNLIGAIAGDIIGSVYEWHNLKDESDFKLFKEGARFTDDTVLTCAVANWLTHKKIFDLNEEDSRKDLIDSLKTYARKFPRAGYGHMFREWFTSDKQEPINSFGNGAGMRCAATAYAGNTLEEVLDLAKKSAEVTHNHPEGIKGAQAIAACTLCARKGGSKDDIKNIAEGIFKYNVSRSISEIRGKHGFDATCQVTVPEAIIAFIESESYNDAILKAIYIGGDSDTIADMAGAIAGAFYGVPSLIAEKAYAKLDQFLKNAINNFERAYGLA